MSNSLVEQRNLLIRMPDGIELAGDVIRPGGGHRVPALLNFNPYHKDGRGGRLDVEATNRHFAARGYAALTVDLRGLGNSGGTAPEPFAPQEGQDGHEVVEWIARQPWCDGNVGMWGLSYPGITALATAATRPPHLKAIVAIHASSDLYHGLVALGGCSTGFWTRADWGPRMVAYNLLPPLHPDLDGRSAKVWAEHLAGNLPWVTAWTEHTEFKEYWQSRAVPVERIECPTFNICGWRDLYAACTPRDFAAITAPKKLLMGPWKHEFPDKGREGAYPGLSQMERWFDRWLKGERNGIDAEPPVTIFVQGGDQDWRSEAAFPPARVEPQDWYPAVDGSLSATAPAASDTPSRHAYDATVGLQSLAWDPWTAALDPSLPHDQSGDDARSLCFTTEPLQSPLELAGTALALFEVTASDLPLHLVVKLADVAPNGRSTLITTGWLDLGRHLRAGERGAMEVVLRPTAYRLAPGRRLRVAVACADFPRIWPTPKPAHLSLFHGPSRLRLPVCPRPAQPSAPPAWGRLQPEVLASPNDLGGEQRWETGTDMVTDTARLTVSRSEHIRLDPFTVIHAEHRYSAAVSSRRPDLACMNTDTAISLERATGRTELRVRTVATAGQTAIDVGMTVDGQPFWSKSWPPG